jgi:uncharacterized protein
MRGSTSRRAALAGLALAAPAVLRGTPAGAATFVSVLTGGTGGTYYPLGVVLAQVLGERLPEVRATAQVTKASVENLNLLQQGKAELGFTTGESLHAAWRGDVEAGFRQRLDRLRGVANLYTNYIHLVAVADSGIATMGDLRGRSLSVGAPKSGNELTSRALLAGAGLAYDDLGKVEYLPFAESVELMKNRQLDAAIISSGLGVSSVRELAAAVPIRLVPIPAEAVARVGVPYGAGELPAGTYAGQPEAVATATVGNYLVSHAGVPDELARAMTGALWESRDRLAGAHSAAAGLRLEAALEGLPIPLHPGAERYYRERGMG